MSSPGDASGKLGAHFPLTPALSLGEREKLPALILASSSPRRRELLAELGVKFAVVTSDAVESESDAFTAVEVAQLNAHRKAHAVAKKHPDALVLGADTLVYLGETVLAKPKDLRDAERMLLLLQGRTHRVVTGVCLVHQRPHRERLFAEVSEVTFLPLTPEQIRDYFRYVNPLDKAGAYAVQEHGDLIISKVSGSHSNVVGLPLERVREELAAWGGGANVQK